MNKHTTEDAEFRRIIAEIDERRTNDQLQQKKLKWFEFILVLSVFVAGIAFAKLFI